MAVSKNQKMTHPPPAAPKPVSTSMGGRLGRISFAISENRWISPLFLALFVILCLLYFPSWGGGDYDMWWHFSLGKHYVTGHTMTVDHAIFSWTPIHPNWHYNTWLGSTITYLAFSAAGGFGLWLFQWGIFGGIFILLLAFVRSMQGKLDLNAICLIFMLVMVEGLVLLYPKPELFTPLLFTALLYIFFSVKRNRISPHGFYLYPLLFVLWVNLHGGFIMGLGVAALLFLAECANHFFDRQKALPSQGLIHLGCALALTGPACLINPYGWAYPWDTLTVTFPVFQQILGDSGSFASSLIAYWPLWSYLLQPGKSNWWTASWLMILLFSLLLIVSVAAFRKRRFWDIGLLLLNPLLFYYGMKAARACIFFPTFAFFSIYYLAEKADLFPRARRLTLLSLILFLLLGSTVLLKLTETSSFNFFGTNLDETVPVREVEVIQKLNLPPPLFNDYVSGGYLMWTLYPEYRVFIDSRGKPYESTHVLADYTNLMDNPTRENLRSIRSRYPFRVVLINMLYVDTILGILDHAGDEWQLLYFDRNAAVLVHRSVVADLDEKARSLDLAPLRFRDVSSPETLSNLFLMYINRTSGEAAVIRDIYERNVSRFYRHREQQLEIMDTIIREKVAMEREAMGFPVKVAPGSP